MDWETLTFTPDGQFHVLDFGFDSYAAACANNLQDADKAILIAWMGVPDVSYPTDEEDWAGCLTLPRELTVRGRRLIQQPLPELKKLRDEKLPFEANEAGCFALPRAAVDRSGMQIRFNEKEGESRTRPLENGLSHLRIFVDSSSIEIFVNDGDAVFTSRIFPTEAEHFFRIEGDTFNRMWTLKRAVKEQFLI